MKPYQIHKSDDDRYFYIKVGANGETMNTSQMYPTKKGAKQGVIDDVNRSWCWITKNELEVPYRKWEDWAKDETVTVKKTTN